MSTVINLFVDLQKAYNNISITKLLEVLDKHKHEFIIAVAQLLYDMKSSTEIGNRITDMIKVNKGVKDSATLQNFI